MIDHIPEGDNVERTRREFDIFESAAADIGESDLLTRKPHSRWRDFATIGFPVRKSCHFSHKKPKTTSHIKQPPRTTLKKLLKEILIHSVARLPPIGVDFVCHIGTPESDIMGITGKR